MQASGNGKAVEIGVVSDKITEELAIRYRALSVKYTDTYLCSHTSSHYNSAITVVDEEHTIESEFIILNKPYKVKITSVKTSDGATIFTKSSGDIHYGTPANGQYAVQDSALFGTILNGRLKFNVSDIGKKILVSYTYHDDYQQTVGSIKKLTDMGCLNDKVVYTTMGTNSISPMTMEFALKEGIVFSEYLPFPTNYRAHTLAEDFNNKLPYLNGVTMSYNLSDGVDDVNLFKKYSKEEIKTSILPQAIQKSKDKDLPYVSYIHDVVISEPYPGSVWQNPTSFHADWKKATYPETLTYIKEMYQWIFSILDDENPYWTTRGRYTWYYQYVNQFLRYDVVTDNDRKLLFVRNTGEKSLKGVTFKIPSAQPTSVKILKDEPIPHNYVDGETIFWIDLLPGESITVEVK